MRCQATGAFHRFASARRPASVIFTREPATTRSACAVASPARTSSTMSLIATRRRLDMGVVYRALYRSSNRPRDTIGTPATLSFDIVALFTLYHCYGGAPRGVPVAPGQVRASQARASRLASATRRKKECACRRSTPPPRGWLNKGRDGGRRRAPRETSVAVRREVRKGCSKK